MGDVVNLNRFRKQKATAERQKEAEVNRRLHGRTKAERAREELQKRRLTHAVDGAKLDPPARCDPAEVDPPARCDPAEVDPAEVDPADDGG